MTHSVSTIPPADLGEFDEDALREMARAVIDIEATGIRALADRIDAAFVEACRHMLGCRGRIVVLGMGKSGHVGSKLAATLASTGSPAFFVHPGEASHGDLGMITQDDVVVALSNSGETDELLTILPVIRRLGVPLIALTGRPESTLARNATVHLDVSVAQEACPLGLAPTASTTAALVMGDALAISLLQVRGFTSEDFARSHPAGRLGRRLLVRVRDILRTGEAIPRSHADDLLKNAIMEMSVKGLGMTVIVDEDERPVGIFTDGDLRRALDHEVDIASTPVRDVMTAGFKAISPEQLAVAGAELMEKHKISALVATDEDGRLAGVFNIHDLMRAGVM